MESKRIRPARVAVVIPCYNVARHIEEVIRTIPPAVFLIVAVDDHSRDDTASQIARCGDSRILLIRHNENRGVGGAMVTGYRAALERAADVIVKMDGDGQMDPKLLALLIQPLLDGRADYTKGNRWHDVEALLTMPALRRWGNLALSFWVKLASGYWHVFDPCNGYTAIRAELLRRLDLSRIRSDYFFEINMLVEMNIRGAVAEDIPMPARYGDEVSSLRIARIIRRFPIALTRSLADRVWQRHFVRSFGPISMFLCAGLLLSTWGVLFGAYQWARSAMTDVPASAGTVMLSAMPLLMGFQLLLQSMVLEVSQSPSRALCDGLPLAEPLEPAAGRAA